MLRVAQSFGVKREGELIWFLNEEDRDKVVFREAPTLEVVEPQTTVTIDAPEPVTEPTSSAVPNSTTSSSTTDAGGKGMHRL